MALHYHISYGGKSATRRLKKGHKRLINKSKRYFTRRSRRALGAGFSALLVMSSGSAFATSSTPAAWQWSHQLQLEGAHVDTPQDDTEQNFQALYTPAIEWQWAPQWQLYGSAYLRAGNTVSELVGDVQGVSNIDAPELARLGELYVQRSFSQGWLKFGRQDENSDFAVSDVAAQFTHSSMGFSPSLNGLIFYPDSAWLLSAAWQLSDQQQLLVGQTQQRSSAEWHWQYAPQSVLKLGYWYHRDLRDWDAAPGQQHASHPYLIWDHQWHSQLSSFVQLAPSDADTGPITRQLGAGVVYDVSAEQAVGLGWQRARLRQDGAPLQENAETVTEFYWQQQLNAAVQVQPVLQYVANPAGRASTYSWVVLLRLNLSFEH